MNRAMNFSAGPAALPLAALVRAQSELVDFDHSGMSIMEQSHRGKVYENVHHEAITLVSELLELPKDYEVLFVQGGASTAFAQIAMNFLEAGKTADYVVNGSWGEKAVNEGRAMVNVSGGTIHVAASTKKDKNYVRVPRQDELTLTSDAAYVHITSNETIHGVEFAVTERTPFPKVSAPLVCDMSSDILGRRIDVTPFDFIYAGAQKNIGPSGVTIIVAKKSMLDRGRKDLPAVLQYRVHAENKSLYNTPPTFGVYLVRNTLAWLKAEGGVAWVEKRNRDKARVLYDVIDNSGGFYRCPVEPDSRSIMNVVWRLPTPELEEAFVKETTHARMIGLKGHRSVGGIRASIYNAVEPEGVAALASFMKDFAARHG